MDITAFGGRRGNGYARQQQLAGEHSSAAYAARSPLSKAASSGFTYVKQQQQQMPTYPTANSQPQASSPKTCVTNGFCSLPRPKRKTAQPAQRRKEVNSALQGYLKSLGSMARSIVLEKETVKQEHHRQWTNMDDAAKEEAVNDHFIPQDIRLQYSFDFPIDRSVSRTSYCSVPSGWPARPHSAHSMNDSNPNNGTSLSQPNDWESDYKTQRNSSQEDLSYREHRGNTLVHQDQSLSLSQPSLSYSYDNLDSTHNPTFNRLHKQQLSFRPSRKQHAVKKFSPLPSSSQLSRVPPQRRGLGSDGESPRTTSDEDFETRNRRRLELPTPQLGFQRSKLRSYSMRSRRGSSANRSGSTRGSLRAQRRKQTSPENNRKTTTTTDTTSRPSHYHTYSTTSTDTDYDAEIDLPEASLLLDHLQGSPDKQSDSRLLRRNSRTRRSLKSTPKLVLHNPSPPSTLTRNATLDSSTDDLDIDESILDEPLMHRTDSHGSLDTTEKVYPQSDDDTLSITASEMSRMTPDSMLSCSSFRLKNKQAELAIFRNRRGKWGGSSYRHVTSNFADRHTQIKANKARSTGSAQTSAATTRASTPAELLNTTSTGEDRLKPPRFAKYGSVTDSVTSDLPRSPDHLVSPPATPSALLAGNATYLFSEKRESGYISSSSESFPVRR